METSCAAVAKRASRISGRWKQPSLNRDALQAGHVAVIAVYATICAAARRQDDDI